jgi:hypothetical protein
VVLSSNELANQRDLNDYIDPWGVKSIPRAIYDHPTLGADPTESTSGTSGVSATVGVVDDYGLVYDAAGVVRYLQAKVIVNVQLTRGDQ